MNRQETDLPNDACPGGIDGVMIGFENGWLQKQSVYTLTNLSDEVRSTHDFETCIPNYTFNGELGHTTVRPGEVKCADQACLDFMS
ncbi:MAG: hypothetical protein HEQ32_07430 [Vampirovibrio sp.]